MSADADLVVAAARRARQSQTHVLTPGFIVHGPTVEHDHFLRWAASRDLPGVVSNLFVPTRARHEDIALSDGAKRLRDEPNAGGNSVLSEVFSYEVLRAMFGARLDRTEMELRYWRRSKITDYSVELFGETVGVSVTRAMKYRGRFTDADAERLLRKKLHGVNDSTASVVASDAWNKQILHVWAREAYIIDVLMRAYRRLDAALKTNTLVLVTVSDPSAWWLYTNDSAKATCTLLATATAAAAAAASVNATTTATTATTTARATVATATSTTAELSVAAA